MKAKSASTRSRRWLGVGLVVLLVAVGGPGAGAGARWGNVARAASGSPVGVLDPGWGDDGIASVNTGSSIEGHDQPTALASDELGRVYVAVEHLQSCLGRRVRVVRFLPDGTLDTAFAADGIADVDLGPGSHEVMAMAIDPAGRVVLAGMIDRQHSYVAMLDEGSLDPSFADDGIVAVDLGPGPEYLVKDVAVDGNGRIVVAGLHGLFPEIKPALLRLTPTGAVDTTFGDGGRVAVQPGEPDARSAAIFVEVGPEDSVSVAGMTTPGGWSVFVGRFDAAGSADPAFGAAGAHVLPGFGGGLMNDLELDQTGAFLLAGHHSTLAGSPPIAAERPYVARADANGVLDPDYGEGGVATIDQVDAGASALEVFGDGSVVATGQMRVPAAEGDYGTLVFKLGPTGELDHSWGAGGLITPQDAGETDSPRGIVLTGDRVHVLVRIFSNAARADLRVHALTTSTGAPVTEWGGDGTVEINTHGDVGVLDLLSAVDAAPDGQVALSGSAHPSTGAASNGLVALLDPAGQLVESFGSGGVVSHPGVSYADVKLLADGRVLAAGAEDDRLLIVRLTAAGEFDASFADGGRLVTDLGRSSAYAYAIAVDANGRIVVLAESDDGEMLVARFDSTGGADPTFGVGGVASIDAALGIPAFFGALHLDDDGPITVAGGTETDAGGGGGEVAALGTEGQHQAAVAGSTADLAVVRLTEAGEPDATFGVNGAVTLDLGSEDYAEGVTVDDEGRVVVSGASYDPHADTYRGVIARFDPSGALDGTFNGGQPLLIGDDPRVELADVAIIGDNIFAGGHTGDAAGCELTGLVVAVDDAGLPDEGLGSGGSYEVLESVQDLTVAGGSLYAGGNQARDMRVAKLDVGPGIDQGTITLELATEPVDATQALGVGGALTGQLHHGANLASDVAPGVHLVSLAPPPGWTVDRVVCDDADSALVDGSVRYEVAADESVTCSVLLTSECAEPDGNLVANPGLVGTSGWTFYTNGSGAFSSSNGGSPCDPAGRMTINTAGTNVQLYQTGISLRAGEDYVLRFRARSSSGRDFGVHLHRHSSPYTSLGLSQPTVDLTPDWQSFTLPFTASGFAGITTDTRLRFWLGPFDVAGEVYWIDSVTIAPTEPTPPPVCSPVADNAIENPSFEGGTTGWSFYTNGNGSFSSFGDDAHDCAASARVDLTTAASNMQLYQPGISLRPDTRYRLQFAARSTNGRDLTVALHKHGAPYSSYGLAGTPVDVGNEWAVFSYEFTTAGFAGMVDDARLRFTFNGHATPATTYWLDGVTLVPIP